LPSSDKTPARAGTTVPGTVVALGFVSFFTGIIGLGALPASILFGLVWQACGAGTAFGIGAGLAGPAAILLPAR